MKKNLWLNLVVGLFLSSLGPTLAGQAGQQNAESPGTLQKEIIKLKYIDATDIISLLQSCRSPEGRIDAARDSNKNNLIVISDHKINVQKMLNLIKELDVKPAELMFTVQLVLGSELAEDKTDDVLKNDPVVKEIQALLKYKNFSLLDTNLVKTIERQSSQVTLGKNGEYALYLKPKYIKDGKEENIQTEIQFGYYFSGQMRTSLIQSTLMMKPGEKQVVGVSKLQPSANLQTSDKGLILIISGKVLK